MVAKPSSKPTRDSTNRELRRAFGDELSRDEIAIWNSLSDDDRGLALKRIRAIARWHAEEADYTPSQAAEDAGVSLSRFYRLAREWEDPDRRSLSKLGLGTTGRRRKKRTRTKGTRLVFDKATELVEADPRDEKSVSQLIGELRSAVKPEVENVPGVASLRSTIVEARRKRDIKDEVGVDLAFDISAVALRNEKGGVHRVGLCVDRGTGLILGASLAPADTAPKCYALVATDALRRLSAPTREAIPWAKRFDRCEFVIMVEKDKAWRDELSDKFPGLSVQPSDRRRRFGRYIRKHVGDGIGKIRLLPTLTLSGTASENSAPKRKFSIREAEAHLAIEVDGHNGRTLERLKRGGHSVNPEMIRFLEHVAGSSQP